MPKPLAGTLVVALEQAVAAPMASRRLADAGARVVKLERPEGDFARGYDTVAKGGSSYFVWLNRGKESVSCDLSKADDRALLDALLARADVFIQNLKPGALGRLGYGQEQLRRQYPKLIVASISGYGDTGPYADRKAYDMLIQAESGLCSVTGGPEAPARIGVSVVDIATGMNLYEAILEALIARGRTGEGADLRVSMFDAMAEWMAVPLLHGKYGTAPKRVGLSHPSVAPYGVFQTADRTPVLISIQNDREWVVLAENVFRRPELAADARYATNVERVKNRAATDALVADWFAGQTTQAAVAALTAADIAFGLLNDVAGLLRHPHLRLLSITTPGGAVDIPAPAARWMGEAEDYGPVPACGADTAKVRAEFLAGAD